ncbi:MAG: TIGR03545 family protein [Elusimicrobiota bacterium]|jgi:uncharacterized protein (TIGR03545 family)
MIRRKTVLPTLILLLVGFLLAVFCLDPFAKWAMIKGGQSVFGARVSIDSVTLSLRHSSLRIRTLAVADKSEPMKNLFQFDEAVFAFRTLPLLEKKVIIDDASLKGLRFGTPRKTSGALWREETRPGFVAKAAGKLWGQVETVSLQKFEGAKQRVDPKTLVNPDKLASMKAAEKTKEQIQKLPEDLQKQINQLNVSQRTDALQKRIQALGQGGNDPSALLQKAGEVKTLQTDLRTLKIDVATAQSSVTERIQSAQGLIEDVKKAREEDWKNLRSTLSLPTLDKETMANALFGPSVAQWMERLLGWIQTARQYMPSKPQSPPPPPRGRGRTIEFPRHNVLPRFLLVKAELSGEIGQERPFGFLGTLTGVTTNPALYGKPATFDLQGSRDGCLLAAKGVLNHIHDTPMDSLQITYDGFSLKDLSFGQAHSMAFGLRQGTGRTRAVAIIQGDKLIGSADVQASNLVLDPHIDFQSSSAMAQRAAQAVTSSLSAVKSLTVGVGLSGTLEAPQFTVTSNIGGVVADAMKNALGSELASQEKALRAELDRQTDGKIKELQGMANDLSQKYLSQFSANNKVIDNLLNQVKTQAAHSVPGLGAKPLDSFKGLFGH